MTGTSDHGLDRAEVNVAVVRGRCSSPAVVRTLPSGRRLASMSVRARTDPSPATSVPVAVWDPPIWVEDLADGDEIVVVGRVRRRFNRPEGGRVEVEADVVARPGRRRDLHRARRAVDTALEPMSG